ADVVGAGGLGRSGLLGRGGRRADEAGGAAAAVQHGAGVGDGEVELPRWTPSAPTASARSRWSSTTSGTPASRHTATTGRRVARRSRAVPAFWRNWTVSAPPATARRASAAWLWRCWKWKSVRTWRRPTTEGWRTKDEW